jgi:DNA repair protein RadC
LWVEYWLLFPTGIESMAITDWPKNERPRERLLRHGAAHLADAELLAIFLRVGVKGKSAVDLARELIGRFGGLNGVFAADRAEFSSIPGVGVAKYAPLQAVAEMARRALSEGLRERDVLTSPEAVRDYLRLQLSGLAYEVFFALWLDARHRLLAAEELFRGTLSQTSVYPREVVKRALAHNAAAVVFAHNHPSGVAGFSAADESLTRALTQALSLVEVRVLDHFIVAGQAPPLSFAERGLLDCKTT